MESSDIIVHTGRTCIGDSRIILSNEPEITIGNELWIRAGYMRVVPDGETPLSPTRVTVVNGAFIKPNYDFTTPSRVIDPPPGVSYSNIEGIVRYKGYYIIVDATMVFHILNPDGVFSHKFTGYEVGMQANRYFAGMEIWRGKLYVCDASWITEVDPERLIKPNGYNYSNNRYHGKTARHVICDTTTTGNKFGIDDYGRAVLSYRVISGSAVKGALTRSTVPIDEWVNEATTMNNPLAMSTLYSVAGSGIRDNRVNVSGGGALYPYLMVPMRGVLNENAWPHYINSSYSSIGNLPNQLGVEGGNIFGVCGYYNSSLGACLRSAVLGYNTGTVSWSSLTPVDPENIVSHVYSVAGFFNDGTVWYVSTKGNIVEFDNAAWIAEGDPRPDGMGASSRYIRIR